uniref:Ankyrin repeat domain-containing protein 33B n=1 Tax=Laticauda laticaudata TaxID=8630 RepID=A0A8C5S0I6_LATLA
MTPQQCHRLIASMPHRIEAVMLQKGPKPTNINATDPGRGFTPLEWACFTGRIESVYLIQRLMDKPCAEQFCDQYLLEWPKLKELLAKAAGSKTCLQKISATLRSIVDFRTFHGPEEDGVLDHMVKTTTSLRSSFVAIACRTVCPESPPAVGKRRPAVQEILRQQRYHVLNISLLPGIQDKIPILPVLSCHKVY